MKTTTTTTTTAYVDDDDLRPPHWPALPAELEIYSTFREYRALEVEEPVPGLLFLLQTRVKNPMANLDTAVLALILYGKQTYNW